MQQLNFKTNLGIVTIELVNTKFVDFWFRHFQHMATHYNLRLRKADWPYYKELDSDAFTIIDKITEVIDKINTLEYLSPLPETVTRNQFTSFDLTTQQLLNRLHRYCVVGTECRNRWLYHDEPTFEWIQWDNDQYMYLLNLLNQNIHHLEEYVKAPNRVKFVRTISTQELIFSASRYTDVDVYADDADLEIPDSMQDQLRIGGYDVWIKKDILGKDFITAFADHDDPAEFDVRPPPMISGGLSIELNNGKDTLYRSEEFRTWLQQPLTDQHGSYPIGQVVAGKHHLLKATTVELI
jgi:hypothetical protein